MTIYYALLACLLGLVLFLICDSDTIKGKVARLAYVIFGVGLLAWLLTVGHSALTLAR